MSRCARTGPGIRRGRRIVGDLREGSDVVGNRTAPEGAKRRNHRVVVGLERVRWRRERCPSVGKTDVLLVIALALPRLKCLQVTVHLVAV